MDASSRDRSSCSRLSWPLKLLEPVASSEAAAPPRLSASVGIVYAVAAIAAIAAVSGDGVG